LNIIRADTVEHAMRADFNTQKEIARRRAIHARLTLSG
jgi:hypothetical protein